MILKPRDVGWSLPTVFMLLILTANPIAEASPESLEILKRIMNAEEKISYVGTRMIIMNTSRGTIAREETVIHQPPGDSCRHRIANLGRGSLLKTRRSGTTQRQRTKSAGGQTGR